MTMAYILAVNPQILSASGMDSQAILMATAIASFIGTIVMALLANYPFALAPGLGLNAYFAFTVCGQMGYSWQFALFAVFLEGLVFIVLSLTNVREAIFNAIPLSLKKGISVGIGLFIAFIGFQNANLVVADASTKVAIVDFTANFNTVGIGALLAIIGTLIIVVLSIKKVKGAILIGIIATWLLGIVCQLTGLYVVDVENGFYSLLPAWSEFNLGAIGQTFGQCFTPAAFANVKWVDLFVIMCSFLMVDMFDTLGTVIGVANKAKMLDEDGKLPRVREVLLADAVATSAGAVLGTSTTTTLSDGTIITSKTTDLLGASAALILNALKHLGGIEHDVHLISPKAFEPIQSLKTDYLGSKNPRLHSDEVLIALALSALEDENAKKAMEQLPKLSGCQVHTSDMLSDVDIKTFKRLNVDLTSEPIITNALKNDNA